MIKDALRGVYYRIRVSKYLLRLQMLNEQFASRNKRGYLQEAMDFYSELLSFALASRRHHPKLFSYNTQFPDKLRDVLGTSDATALNSISGETELFLNGFYSSLVTQKHFSKRLRAVFSITALLVLILLTGIGYPRLKQKYLDEKEEYDIVANEGLFREKTLQDVLALKQALQKYYNDYHSYPKSSGGFDGVLAAFGESKEEWIPGLAPKYIEKLPRDPRRSKDAGKQYMYKSDGKEFKLIAHNPLGIEDIVKKHPELVDPARPSWAFGAWTEGAKNW